MAAPTPDCPRVRVAAAILLEGQLVVVAHRTGDQSYFLLPGGGVEAGESLFQALVREVREETGLTIEPGIPLLINDTIDPSGARHVVNLTFAADITGGNITDRPEDPRVESVALVELAQLPTLDLRPPFGPTLATALNAGPEARASYLGPLWTDSAHSDDPT